MLQIAFPKIPYAMKSVIFMSNKVGRKLKQDKIKKSDKMTENIKSLIENIIFDDKFNSKISKNFEKGKGK